MTLPIEVSHSESISDGAFRAHRGDEELGELTLVKRGQGDTWVANHTYVSPAARGQGVAKLMFLRMTEWARAQDQKIVPSCSYIHKMFIENEDQRDVLSPSTPL